MPAAAAALGQAAREGRIDMTDTMDVTANPPVLHWYQAAVAHNRASTASGKAEMTQLRGVKAGEELPPFTRTAGFANWNRYAAVNDEFVPIHMDDEAGRAAGYPTAFGMGNLQWAYLHNLVRDWLGDERRDRHPEVPVPRREHQGNDGDRPRRGHRGPRGRREAAGRS